MHYDIRLSFFIVELMVATALFSSRRQWRCSWRLLAVPAVVLVYGFGVDGEGLGRFSPVSQTWYEALVYYASCVAVLVLLTRLVTHASWVEALITVCAGYAVQHIAYDVLKFILIVAGARGDVYFTLPYYVLYLSVYVLTYALSWLVVGRRFSANHEALRHKPMWVLGALGLLLFVIVANLVVGVGWPVQVQTSLVLYDAICTALVLTALNIAATNDRLKEDLLSMRRTARMQRRHYEMSRAGMEQINITFHDLRKRLNAISGSGAAPALVDQAQRAVTQVDSLFHTGNPALDVVLSQQSLYCSKHGIAFTCMADGSALDFMDDDDLYSLFGNMLDNAVEAVMKLDDSHLRVIDMNVEAKAGFVRVEERNYFAGELTMVGGLPRTTHADVNLHGFGMRSMAQQVKHYDGTMRVRTQDGVFTLSVVFPQASRS